MTRRRITGEIKAELERIAAASTDGRLHWADVVAAARQRSNPLHSYFDWDKQRGLEHYLRYQAEQLIGTVQIAVIHPTTGQRARTRAFVSLSTDRQSGGGYRSVLQVLSDADMHAQLLRDALADLASFRARYARLGELSALFRAIEQLESANAQAPRLDGAGLRALRQRLGLSVTRAAQLLEVAPRSFQRWENGDRPVPQNIGRLLRKLAAQATED